MNEISTKPYLLRALYEWCTDNGYTPHLAVVVDAHTRVPPEHVHDGQIVLNIGALATQNLVMGNEFIEFQARFGGVAREISVPVPAVQAIYARENGQGMAFPMLESDEEALDTPDPDEHRPALSAVPDAGQPAESASAPVKPPEPPDSPDGGGRPRLTVVK